MSLIVSDLSKKYGEKTVVNHISFSMPKPGVYALLGTNGAGKTTTIRMMLGMLSKDTGSVQWNGRPLDTATCNVGYLAEERGLYPKYGLMDQLIYFAGLRGVSKHEAKTRIKYWAHRLQVEEYLYPDQVQEDGSTQLGARGGLLSGAKRKKAQKPKLADQLSKGNQQKIQFMTALISNPDLIILDEPMSGLDPVNTDLFKDIIREEIAKGKYLIMSSHQMATVEEYCRDLLILKRGRTVLQGNLHDIKAGYGHTNLSVSCRQDVTAEAERFGLRLIEKTAGGCEFKMNGDESAHGFLKALVDQGIYPERFEIREPSLHEIFVEKVGEAE